MAELRKESREIRKASPAENNVKTISSEKERKEIKIKEVLNNFDNSSVNFDIKSSKFSSRSGRIELDSSKRKRRPGTASQGRDFGENYQQQYRQDRLNPGPSRVVVTASNRRGDSQENLQKNVPPPRLNPTAFHQDDYHQNYPGADLRLMEPQPSHLTGLSNSQARVGSPHSIVFGSSSNSRGAYHVHRQKPDYIASYIEQEIPPPPIHSYNPNDNEPQSSGIDFRPSRLMNMNNLGVKRTRPPNYRHPQRTSTTKQPDIYNGQHSNNHDQYNDRPSTFQTTTATTTVTRRRNKFNYKPNGETDPSILTQLSQLSKSGVRRQPINHRTIDHDDGINNVNDSPNYDNDERKQYNGFIRHGEVYNHPPSVQRTRRPLKRITTMRPLNDRPGIPFDATRSPYLHGYSKNNIQEMDFDPKTIDNPINNMQPASGNSGVGFIQNLPPNYWFLMPVQAWFTLCIVLGAVVLILGIVCIILYHSLKKQRRKVRKLLSPGLLMGSCIDPLHHELCSCRNISTLMRSHASPMTRASMMSRMSHRSTAGNHGVNAHRSGIINYDNAAQVTTGFRSLPSPSIKEREQLETDDPGSMDTVNADVKISKIDDGPPPLAPKVSIGRDTSGSKPPISHSKYHDGFTLKRTSTRATTKLSHSKYEKPSSSISAKLGLKTSNNSDVQLTTIYPPPSRFEL